MMIILLGIQILMRRIGCLGLLIIGLIFALIGEYPIAYQQVVYAHEPGPRVIRYDAYESDYAGPQNYVLSNAKWDHQPVTFSVENCPHTLDCNLAKDAVRQAMQAWDVVCGIQLAEVGSNGDIRVGWYTQQFDGPGDILGRAYFPYPYLGDLAGDVQMDDAETWVVDVPTSPSQIHLQTALTHEIGHAIGLDHSHDPTAIMYAEYFGVRSLAPDDIAACQALYGSPDNANGGGSLPPSGVSAIATTTVRVRSGPGLDFEVLANIPQATSVSVMGRNAASDWFYVDYQGTRGWAAAWLFIIDGDLSSVPEVDQNGNGVPSSPTPAPTGVTGVASTTIRLRSGPGTFYSPLGNISAGTVVNILGKDAASTWLYVDVFGTQGWVAGWLFTINGDLNTVPVLDAHLQHSAQ